MMPLFNDVPVLATDVTLGTADILRAYSPESGREVLVVMHFTANHQTGVTIAYSGGVPLSADVAIAYNDVVYSSDCIIVPERERATP